VVPITVLQTILTVIPPVPVAVQPPIAVIVATAIAVIQDIAVVVLEAGVAKDEGILEC